MRHYFPPGNLTALRELALRRTAQRVDNQMVDYMRSHAIEGPWPAGDRVLVCVQGGPKATATVRHAKRLADQLRAPWTAISVETDELALGRQSRNRTASWPRCGWRERLGAEPVLIPGQDVADTVIDYARANNVTHLIVGKSDRPRWRQLLPGLGDPAADQPRRRHQHPCDRGRRPNQADGMPPQPARADRNRHSV